MAQWDRVLAVARQTLTLTDDAGRGDLWLWEHSERVMRLARAFAKLPEFARARLDGDALAAACLFHDAGWAAQFRQGRFDRWQVLSRPTNDVQRELGAGLLQEQCGHLLPAEAVRRAVQAIRECNDRNSALPEAQLLVEAENLDDIGTLYVLRQFRQYQAEGRPLEQLITSWARQKEYNYWDARVNDLLRTESARQLARQRLASVDQFIQALARDHAGADAAALVASSAAPVAAR